MGAFAGVNHPGFVVTDLDQAEAFFTGVLGFTRVEGRGGKNGDAESDVLTRRLGIHPRATGEFRFYSYGDQLVELLAWSSPDQNTTEAANSDVAGRHLAVSTTDYDAAVAAVRAFPGTEIRERHPAGYVYVKTPFGLEIQIVPVAQ